MIDHNIMMFFSYWFIGGDVGMYKGEHGSGCLQCAIPSGNGSFYRGGECSGVLGHGSNRGNSWSANREFESLYDDDNLRVGGQSHLPASLYGGAERGYERRPSASLEVYWWGARGSGSGAYHVEMRGSGYVLRFNQKS